MANLKISQLTPGNPAQSGDLIPVDRTGTNVSITAGSIATLASGAPLNSPAFTGIPTAPTAANGTNTTQIATTAFVLANAAGTTLIASGTATLNTAAIPAVTAATVVTVAAAGVVATDSIEWAFNATPGTGYTTGLHVLVFTSSGAVNFSVVNPTAGALTPAAATLNWRVIR